MAGERPNSGEQRGLTVWQPVIDKMKGLSTVGTTAVDLRNPLARQRAMTGGSEAARQAREQLGRFIPQISYSVELDGTGSMSSETGVVRADLAPFLNRVIVKSFESIPQEVQAQISADRQINWTRIDFGDGNPIRGGSLFSWAPSYPLLADGEEVQKAADMRIDMPYLSVKRGSMRTNNQDLPAAAERINSQFRQYNTSFSGGGNHGESSPEAILAGMGVLPQNPLQRQLLLKLLDDCRTVESYGKTTDRRSQLYGDLGHSYDSIVPYLELLVSSGAVPVQALHALESQVQAPPLFDLRFLITDEPAAGYATKIEDLEALRTDGSFFAIITPKHVYDTYWVNHIQALGATWYDLNQLAHADPSMDNMNFTQRGFADAVAQKVSDVVIKDISKVLQLTSGNSGSASPGSIVRK